MDTTILLVEDNQALRLIYKNQLVHDGYTIIEAATTKEAYELMQNHVVNLLLLDILLPDKNGLTFLEELRKESRFLNLPVIMLTSLPDEIAFEKSQKLGIHGYLVKDQVTPAQIAAHIKLALEEKKVPA
jgi:CheY-like chemotaxis protein